jgi:hypothetical protein
MTSANRTVVVGLGRLNSGQNENRSMENISADISENDFSWFYQGYKGWWKYDKYISILIENEYQRDQKGRIECKIFENNYIIDFDLMCQIRVDDNLKRRKIKRDSSDATCKGIAGTRFQNI